MYKKEIQELQIQIREHNLIYLQFLNRAKVKIVVPYRQLPVRGIRFTCFTPKRKIYIEEKLATLQRAGEDKKKKKSHF